MWSPITGRVKDPSFGTHMGPITIIGRSLDHASIRMHTSGSPLGRLDGTRTTTRHSADGPPLGHRRQEDVVGAATVEES